MINLNQFSQLLKKGKNELKFGVIKKIRYGINKISYEFNRRKILDNDYFLVSYPKSGNTWLRFLLLHSIFDKNGHYNEKYGWKIGNVVEYLVPGFENPNKGIDIDEDLKMSKLENGFTIYKSHIKFNPGFKNVIYLVRDPRDVFISYYHYYRRINRIPLDAKMDEIINLYLNGKLDTYGSWDEHVRFWTAKFKGRIIIIKYEDLLKNIETQLGKIYSFLGITIDKEVMTEAIEKSSFENLTKWEDKASKLKHIIEKDRNLKFVRKGKAGQWKDELNEELIFKIKNKFHDMMAKFKYLEE